MTESARLAKVYGDNALLSGSVPAGCTGVESGGAI
jgi:hypothetical protein